jgi:tetratricopeptide (TPR) repeat protein
MKKKTEQAETLPVKKDRLKGNRPYYFLALLSLLVYLPTLWYGFSPLDERWLFLKQLDIMSDAGNLPLLYKSAITGMYYRPVLMNTFMFDLIIGNGSAAFFHFTNVLIHTLCVVLLYRFLMLTGLSKNNSLMAAAIFAVHPLAVHTVAWIPGRNDSLLCLFALLSCIQLLNYLRTKKAFHIGIHFIAFILALLTKENAIVLPLIYLLLWLLFDNEKDRSRLLVMGICWLIFCAGWFLIRKSVVDHLSVPSTASFGQNVLYFLEGLVIFSGKTILPFKQSVMAVLQDSAIIAYLVVTIIVAALAIKFKFHDKRIAYFGLTWFFAFLILPVWFGAITTNHDIYEHRAYTSLIGAFLFITQLKITLRSALVQRGFVLVLILFSAATILRSPAYRSEISFLEAATIESPSISLMHDMLGFKYTEMKEYSLARERFDEAIRLNPRPQYYNHRGNLHYQAKNYPLALEDFNKTLAVNDSDVTTYVNRSMTNFYLGNNADALNDFNAAINRGAKNIPRDFAQALYEALQNDTIMICTQQLLVDSLNASVYNKRGAAKMRLGLFKEALEDFDRALALDPDADLVRANRQLALANLRKKRQ